MTCIRHYILLLDTEKTKAALCEIDTAFDGGGNEQPTY
jgi:hypothetical protein